MSGLPPIYFIRHGETDWNRQGLIQGSIDTPLNELGHQQARAVARAVATVAGLSRDFTLHVSPQLRARQTMGYITSALGLSDDRVLQEPDVRELGFGIWEGKPFWELKASPIYPADLEGRYYWRPEGGESYEDGEERAKSWLSRISGPALVVAHGAIGRCLMGRVAGLKPGDLVALKTPQGCYCRLQDGQIDWFDANGDQA
jgi:probable phosphoglycerate mutase